LRTDKQIFYKRTGFLANVFQVIHRCELCSIFRADLHFECASQDFAFVAGGGHFDVAGRTNINAGAASAASPRSSLSSAGARSSRSVTKKDLLQREQAHVKAQVSDVPEHHVIDAQSMLG
jgi:hypothetical protein